MPRPSQRARLLDAAADVIAADGIGALTLDAVAARAGVSKGGLLYHFRSKNALVAALVEHRMGQFHQRLAGLVKRGVPFLPAYVKASLEMPKVVEGRVGTALLAAVATDPKLMAPVRAHFAEVGRMVGASPVAFEQAAAVMLAVDGLWLLELLGIAPFTPAQRKRVVAGLLAAAQPPDAAPFARTGPRGLRPRIPQARASRAPTRRPGRRP